MKLINKIEKTLINWSFIIAIIMGICGLTIETNFYTLTSWFLFSMFSVHCYSMGYYKYEDKQ